MDLGLSGKSVFVAGSSRGIGRATALAFLREGAMVTITGREGESLREFESLIRTEFGEHFVLACQGDLGDPAVCADAVERSRDRFGRLDCLVLNVGSGSGDVGRGPERSEWNRMYDENLWASVGVVQAGLDAFDETGGSIIFIASIAGLEALGAPLPYATAKAALVQYSGELARRLASRRIRVNTVAPGNILFPGGSWERLTTADPERWKDYIDREVPQKRFGTPEEIADAVLFLASERSSFTTGACLVVDGGQTKGA